MKRHASLRSWAVLSLFAPGLALSACGEDDEPKPTDTQDTVDSDTAAPDTSDTASPADTSAPADTVPTPEDVDTSDDVPAPSDTDVDSGETDVDPMPDTTPGPDDCEPGSYLDESVCSPCPEGTFSNTVNATICEPWTECTGDSVEIAPPSATKDRLCLYEARGVWMHGTTDADTVKALRLDLQGYIYVLIKSGDTHHLKKLDSEHNTVFSLALEAGYTYEALTMSKDGNALYVGGFGRAAGSTQDDGLVVRVSLSGDIEWSRSFGTSGAETLRGLDTDLSGNVYAVGNVNEAAFPGQTAIGATDGYVYSFTAEGEFRWVHQFGTNKSETGRAIQVSRNTGNIFVTGETRGNLGGVAAGSLDIYVRALNVEGTPIWNYQFGTDTIDLVMALLLDADGGLYVAGVTSGIFPGETRVGLTDGYLTRLNTDGAFSWTRQFGTSEVDRVSDLAVAPNGHIYVSGWTNGGEVNGQSVIGGLDGFLFAFAPHGERMNAYRFGTVERDNINALAISPLGTIYLGGETDGSMEDYTNAGSSDAFVIGFNPFNP